MVAQIRVSLSCSGGGCILGSSAFGPFFGPLGFLLFFYFSFNLCHDLLPERLNLFDFLLFFLEELGQIYPTMFLVCEVTVLDTGQLVRFFKDRGQLCVRLHLGVQRH